MRMILAIVLLLLPILVVPDLCAQAPRFSRGRVSGIVGAGRTWDDEGSLGPGIAVGGRIDWRLFGNTRVEGAFDLLTHDRSSGFSQAEGESAIFSASMLQGFGGGRAQPYVLGGLSLVRHSGTTRFDNRSFDRKSTDHGLHFGGGVSVRLGQRWEVGPEARQYLINAGNDSDPALAFWIGGRFGIRF